jgi:hypothetical protein
MFDIIFTLPTPILLLISIFLSFCTACFSAWRIKRQIRSELLILGLTSIEIRWLWWKTTRQNMSFAVSYLDQGSVYHQTECLSSTTSLGGCELFWQESPRVGGVYRPNPLLNRWR